MITPPFLKPGDTVAIVAPGRKVSLTEMEPAFSLLKSWGLKVVTGPNLFGSQDQYSGTDEARASDLQIMLDNETVSAIICARGGYGTVRIIDKLNFDAFSRTPKWVVGYSDVTVLHSHIQSQLGIETLHATMPINFPPDGTENESTRSLHDALFGQIPEYSIAPASLNRNGKAEGELTGGNLSILYALNGTPSEVNYDGKILFIEELDEYLYHIDRMMMTLKRSGKLAKLSGLIVGEMTKMNDNTIPFGKTAGQIVADAVAEYDYPVCFGFPAGHQDINKTLFMGRTVMLDVDSEKVAITFGNEY
jgi:muramoyltetrapeptide carboxypeptidase